MIQGITRPDLKKILGNVDNVHECLVFLEAFESS